MGLKLPKWPWLQKAWEAVRRAPIARWIKPIWKGELCDLIDEKGDELQAKLMPLLAEQGPRVIDERIDVWQKDLIKAIDRLPLPQRFEQPLKEAVQKHGDRLQDMLKSAYVEGGLPAVSEAFDKAQETLKQRIDAL